MPSYRENQFISNWLRPQAGEYTNAPFIYPRRRVRTFDDVRTRVEAGLTIETSRRVATDLDRGFIRNLAKSSAMGTLKRQRLNFQFNPSDIEQAVQMRQDVYLPILQDPSQYAQPMSAVATFNFDLLFDRTMEVGRGRGRGGTVDLMGDIDPAEAVYQIGVLSDLQVLYSIIGQGFSNDFIAQQLETIKAQAKASAKDEYASDDAGYSQAISEIDSATVESFQGSANLGNNAFLIPMPVRIVFSELFMVDGFVTGTTVRFTKFNTNMVPIQASVGISMNAMYIGFAKEETFLTVQLGNLEENLKQELIQQVAEDKEILTAVRRSASKFVFACDSQNDWLKGVSTTSAGTPIVQYVYQQAPPDNDDYPDVEFKLGFEDAKLDKDSDNVLNLFKAGKNLTFSRNWSLSVYGPYDTFSSANTDKTAKKISSGVKRAGYYIGNRTDSDADAWDESRSRSVRSDHPSTDNVSSDKLVLSPSIDYASKYYVVNFEITLSFNNVSKSLSDWRVRRGDQAYKYSTKINWPYVTDDRSYVTAPVYDGSQPAPPLPRAVGTNDTRR